MPIDVLAVLGAGVVPADTLVAAADDLGVTRGDGCFEGCRLRRHPNGTVAFDDLDRMGRSAAALEIDFDEAAWRKLLADAADVWAELTAGETEAATKLVLTRGRPEGTAPTGFLTIRPLEPHVARQRRDGIRVITLSRGTTIDAYANAPSLVGGVKLLSYAVNMAALREAKRRRADEVLLKSVPRFHRLRVSGTRAAVASSTCGVLPIEG